MHDFFVILPNIRSCHNIGAMFRNADAFGVNKLYLVGWTATPPKPQIDKVALGAETWVPWEHWQDVKELIVELKKQGVHIIALEQTSSSVDLESVLIDKPIALIVGNEVTGVPSDITELCDTVAHISMYGKKESLNVSVAAGIAMHVVSRKLREVT